jgi:hypothetical protein
MSIYLVSYRPLIGSQPGRDAIAHYNLPPYIDDSCRREPDFQSPYPSISALCRKGKFAPRLRVEDIVVYITKKGKYPGLNEAHWCLTALLKVGQRFASHAEAAQWYRDQQIDLPSNCMVAGNPPLPLDMTALRSAITSTETSTILNMKRKLPVLDRTLLQWDQDYQKRADMCGVFLACVPLFKELYHPPIITEATFWKIFKRIPGTRNPPAISMENFEYLKALCGI